MPKLKIKNLDVDKKYFSNIFLWVLIIVILYLSFLLFRPFLKEIAFSGVLVAIFYPVYLKIVYWTRGMITLSAIISTILIILIIIIPFSLILVLSVQQAISLSYSVLPELNRLIIKIYDMRILDNLDTLSSDTINVKQIAVDSAASFSRSFLAWITSLLMSITEIITNFFLSLLLIAFTMFFLFRDGRDLLRRLMQLTPLSNKYDKLIWHKFSDVSYTALVATFITSSAQAISGALAFLIVGLPALLPALLIFLFSFLPYVGTAVVWFPISVYLLMIGKTWQGIFMFCWGAVVISFIDNLLSPYLIKGKAKVHPLIIFFSIFGGLALMGIWGIVFGPLIVALAVTILHIYELEYEEVLER